MKQYRNPDGTSERIPTSMRGDNMPPERSFISTFRELYANAKTWHARSLRIAYFHHDGQDYLAICTDADPFEDDHDIVFKGCTPNSSGGQGHSVQGNGMVYVAMRNSRDPLLLVMSRCKKDGEVVIGYGRPDWKKNEWDKGTTTEEWDPVLKEILGEMYEQCNVCIVTRIDLHPGGKRKYIRPAIMNSAALVSGKMMDDSIAVRFVEWELGYPYPELDKREQYRTFTNAKHWNADTKKPDKIGANPGQLKRVAVSHAGFQRRLLNEGHSFEIEWVVESWEIPSVGMVCNNVRGRFLVDFYSGTRNKEAGGNYYLTAVRADEDGEGSFGLGKTLDIGEIPTVRCIGLLGFVGNQVREKYPDDAERWTRFDTNAVITYTEIGTVIRNLGMHYREGTPRRSEGHPDAVTIISEKPFGIVTMIVDDVESVTNKRTKQTKPMDALELLDLLDRRSDCFCNNKEALHELFKLASLAGRCDTPEEAIRLSEELFPYDTEGFIDLLEGMPTQRVEPPKFPERRYEIFFADQKGAEFDGKLHAGKHHKICIYSIDQGRFVRADGLKEAEGTRGVESIKDIPAEMMDEFDGMEETVSILREAKHVDRVPVVSLKISDLYMLDGNDRIRIATVGYVHNGHCFPTRRIWLEVCGGRDVFVGNVEEAKPKHRPKGIKLARKDIGGDVDNNSPRPIDVYQQDSPWVFCDWDERRKVLTINPDHRYAQYFRLSEYIGDDEKRKARQVYSRLNEFAKKVVDMKTKAKLTAENADVFKDEYGDNVLKWMLNDALKWMMEHDAYIQDKIKGLEKPLDERLGRDGLEVEAEAEVLELAGV